MNATSAPALTRRRGAHRNEQTADRILDLLSAHDIPAVVDLFTEDGHVMAPFSPPPLLPGADGRAQIRAVFAAVFAGYGRAQFLDRRITATEDPDVVVARWRTDIEVLASGRTHAAEVIALFEFRHGLITRLTECFNPDVLRAAGALP